MVEGNVTLSKFSNEISSFLMSRYFLHLAYRGANYNGWQSQQNAPGIQDVVERCLGFRLGHEIRITGCGRTDTGVHARNYYAHFDSQRPPEMVLSADFLHRMNICLPPDIVVFQVLPVSNDAHARFDAISRTYNYYFHTFKNPFLEPTSYYIYGSHDFEAMNRCAALLPDYDDFTSFSKLHSQTKTNICRVSEARITQVSEGYAFVITADRFLRNMVRAIAGTLFEVGKGKLDEAGFRGVIEGKNRALAGFSVPAHALFLEDIRYPYVLSPIENQTF